MYGHMKVILHLYLAVSSHNDCRRHRTTYIT